MSEIQRSEAEAIPASPHRPASGGAELGVRGPARTSRLLVLPTLNEEVGLEETLRELSEVFGQSDGAPTVLVVDGHSTDRTREVARRFHADFLLQTGKGKGAAVRNGLDWALDHGFDTVAVIDADATYPCRRLPALFGLLETGSELVLGVRRPDHPSSTTPRDLVHRVGNVLLNLCAAQLSRGPIMDVCTGFWGVRTGVTPGLALESDGFEIESELFVKAFRRHLKVVQIPVEYRRRVGSAKLRAVRDGSRILLSILRHSVRVRSPELPDGTPPLSPTSPTPPEHPEGVPLRDLESVVLTLDPQHLLMVTPPEHYRATAAIARGLEDQRPGLEAVTTTTEPNAQELGRMGAGVEFGEPSSGANAPVVVTLTPGPWGAHEFTTVVVEIPRSRRVVCLRSANESPRHPFDFLERSLIRAPGIFALLGATIDTSGVQKELTLLRANASDSALDIFRTRRPRRRVEGAADGSGAARVLRLLQRW